MFTHHYKNYRDKIYSHFLYRTGDAGIAEDLSSITFIKAYEAFDQYNDQYAFSTWIYTIAHNVLIDHYRHDQRFSSAELSEDHYDKQVSPELILDEKILLEHIYEGLQILSETQQRCMTYRYVDGFSISDISDVLSLSVDATKQHLSRGRRRLRTFLSEHYNYQI